MKSRPHIFNNDEDHHDQFEETDDEFEETDVEFEETDVEKGDDVVKCSSVQS